MKNNDPNQITEEIKQSEVQKSQNGEDSDESVQEEQEIDDFNDNSLNKKGFTVQAEINNNNTNKVDVHKN